VVRPFFWFCAASPEGRVSRPAKTARFGDARWLVSDPQIPWQGMDQLAPIPLFCSRRAVQCTACNPLFLSRTVSLWDLLCILQSLISLTKFTLGRQRWNRFSRNNLKIELMTRRASRFSRVLELSSLSTRGHASLV
jgi:hypothetical protein